MTTDLVAIKAGMGTRAGLGEVYLLVASKSTFPRDPSDNVQNAAESQSCGSLGRRACHWNRRPARLSLDSQGLNRWKRKWPTRGVPSVVGADWRER